MSVGPLSFVATAAATPLAQSKGSDVDRAEQEASVHQGKLHNDLKAEEAAGIGQTDGEDHETEERDADGRRLWEPPPKKKDALTEAAASADLALASRDPSGQRGTTLDLTG